MDRKLRNVAALGLLTIVAVVALVWGVYFLMGTPFWRGGLDLVLLLENGAGLKRGDPVLVQGVHVGTVRSVDLSATSDVVVDVRLRGDLLLPADTRASVAGDVFGAHTVSLEPGDALVRLEAGDTVRGTATPQLTDIAADLSAQARSVLISADELISAEAVRDIHATAAVLPSAATELRAAFTEFRMAAASLRRTSENLETVDANAALDRVASELETSARKLGDAATSMQTTLDSFASVMSKIDGGQGTLGRLVNDAALYDELSVALREMRLLTTDIRERPGRYFSISIFGR